MQPHALRPLLQTATQCFGARHVNHSTKGNIARQVLTPYFITFNFRISGIAWQVVMLVKLTTV